MWVVAPVVEGPRRLQVKPLWGQRLKWVMTEAQYYEVSPAGHCPQHEAPAAVALALSSWLQEVNPGICNDSLLYSAPVKNSTVTRRYNVITACSFESQKEPRHKVSAWESSSVICVIVAFQKLVKHFYVPFIG